TYCDHTEEQMLPLTAWGKNYVAPRMAGQSENCSGTGGVPEVDCPASVWRVAGAGVMMRVQVAAPTGVTLSPPDPTFVLAPEVVLEVPAAGSGATRPGIFLVSAQKPILVMQLAGGEADMVTAVPVEQYLPRYLFQVPSFFCSKLTVSRKMGVVVLLDGVAIADSLFTDAGGGYQVGRLPIGMRCGSGTMGMADAHTSAVWPTPEGRTSPAGSGVLGVDLDCSYGYVGGLSVQVINDIPYPPAGRPPAPWYLVRHAERDSDRSGSGQRAGLLVCPRHARARFAQARARVDGQKPDRDPALRGGARAAHRQDRRLPGTASTPAEVGDRASGRPRRGGGRPRGRARGRGRMGRDALVRAAGRVLASGRASGHALPAAAQRGHHARAVQDRAPGRDRRRLRIDRLLALERSLCRAHLQGAALFAARQWKPARAAPPERRRAGGDAVQLHVDRRQPADCTRHDGQRGGVEAGADGHAVGVVDHADLARGRAARRGHQLRTGSGRSGVAGCAPARGAGGHPFYRLDRRVPEDVADGGREHHALS